MVVHPRRALVDLNVLNHSRVHGLLESVAGMLIKRLTGAILAWSLPCLVRGSQLRLHGLVGGWKEYHFRIRRLRHGLHRFQISDLHGWRRAQDVGGLSHQFCAFDLGSSGDDLAFSDPLALGSHRERVLQIFGEDDVLDEHRLDLYPPAECNIFDDLTDRLGDLFATLDHVLQDASTYHVAQGGLRPLYECLPDVADAESGFVGRDDVIVDDGGEAEGDIVLCHADLTRYFNYLDLDINLDEALRERIDLDETGIDGTGEFAELCD